MVAYVDEVQVVHYDSESRKAEAKQDWMNQITEEDPNYWQRETENFVAQEQVNKVNIEILKKRFNQTGGVHTYQWMSGCEWNDETDEVKGWHQHGYDGEDFMSLDMKTWTYTAAKQQAFLSKLKWDQEILRLDYQKYYYTEECPSYLKKYVEYGKEVLMRTELPEVFLLQKTPSSPVTCMATGFYPDLADLFWRKDGEQMFEDVEHGELLPNHDGTFQMSVGLKVEVTADVEGKYECVFQLSGVEEDLVTKLERRSILSNASHEDHWSVAIGATAAVVAVAALLAAIFLVRRHRQDPQRQSTHSHIETQRDVRKKSISPFVSLSFQPNTIQLLATAGPSSPRTCRLKAEWDAKMFNLDSCVFVGNVLSHLLPPGCFVHREMSPWLRHVITLGDEMEMRCFVLRKMATHQLQPMRGTPLKSHDSPSQPQHFLILHQSPFRHGWYTFRPPGGGRDSMFYLKKPYF
ncbi:class I histocompatibility antigen, F10 alpha chain-like [Entelurus aequoreus]|uniref:class I histocompatibility antigen, F10 alpha chain-like n=1 Tax=Entelurus aequoreus TaxID=161455 RepID=UPI002B1E4082|nr:class I histocompatibility antigen, F10 alpha chain-like [Entelurus aequoreus]